MLIQNVGTSEVAQAVWVWRGLVLPALESSPPELPWKRCHQDQLNLLKINFGDSRALN